MADNHISIFGEDRCLVWLQFEIGGEDIYPTILDDCPPDEHWLEYELAMAGWDCILFPDHVLVEGSHGWGYGFTWITWALKNGIAPYQPFLLVIEKPEYHICSGYGDPDEWDADFAWDLICVQELPMEDILAHWEEWEKEWAAYSHSSEQAMSEFKERRATDVAAMYIQASWYFGPRDNYRDEMCPPNGLEMAICSRHTRATNSKWSWPTLLSVREDDGMGRRAEALARLKKRAMEELGLTEGQFNSLPWR